MPHKWSLLQTNKHTTMNWLVLHENSLKDYRRQVAVDGKWKTIARIANDFFEMHFEEPYVSWDGVGNCGEHYRQNIRLNQRAVHRFKVWESTQLTKAQAVVRGVLTSKNAQIFQPKPLATTRILVLILTLVIVIGLISV